MDIIKKIKMAIAYSEITQGELASRMNMSPQAFSQRMKTGKFSSDDLDKIAEALGAEFSFKIKFSDGTEI